MIRMDWDQNLQSLTILHKSFKVFIFISFKFSSFFPKILSIVIFFLAVALKQYQFFKNSFTCSKGYNSPKHYYKE